MPCSSAHGLHGGSRGLIRTLDSIAELRGHPSGLRVDHGPENVAGATLQWSVDHDMLLHFIDPGKPAQKSSEAASSRETVLLRPR
ncbi:MAG: hypothetical protein WBW76_01330 [Candidatus Cybelea sp.]